jgi:hypothetical protein
MQVQQDQSHPSNSNPQLSPTDHKIDPAIASSATFNMSAGDSDDNTLNDSRKGRRELSTSKRAAQNRAAQVSSTHYSSPIEGVAHICCRLRWWRDEESSLLRVECKTLAVTHP